MPVIESFNAQGPFGIADVDHDIGDMTILAAGCLPVIGTHGGNQGCRYLFGIPNLALSGEGVDGFGGDFLNKGLEAIRIVWIIARGKASGVELLLVALRTGIVGRKKTRRAKAIVFLVQVPSLAEVRRLRSELGERDVISTQLS